MVTNNSVDVGPLLDRIDDDRSFLTELVDIFRRDYPQNIEAVKTAIHTQNAAALQGSAHTLKGALGNLSAIGAAALAGELEGMGRSLELSGAQSTLDRLVDELPNVMRALEALCPIAAQ